MGNRRWTVVVVAAVVTVLCVPIAGRAEDPGFASECLPVTDAPVLTVGVVECQRFASAAIGGVTTFSYYVPPACAPANGRRCPVVYFLHGTGGTYQGGLGAKGTAGNAFVAALTAGPPVDPRTQAEPWLLSSPSTWVPKPPLDLILVAPHGLTVPGGYGAAPGNDTGWADWNPKYARGGVGQRYDTPPPNVETFLVHELVPYVDRHFPTGRSREWRAITGKSQGGFGSFANGLAHPDVWSVQAMFSGGGFPFPLLAVDDPDSVAPVQVEPVAPVPYLDVPGPLPMALPEAAFTAPIAPELTVGFGDVAVDNVWWRSINPTDLISNGRAWSADGTQSTFFKYHVNDAVPRRFPDDLVDPNYAANQAFEAILFPADLYMERVFDRHGVQRVFHVGPGLHNNDPYQQPYYREHMEAYAAHLRSGRGPDKGLPPPVRFDYRTIRTDFTIWGWRFAVAREPVEFLFLTDVSCDSITLRGSGVVTVTVPAACRTGASGERVFSVDLGPSQPVDDPGGLSSMGDYGRVVTVPLCRRSATCG
jgi:S-formylglutathione hydrolase FrmB